MISSWHSSGFRLQGLSRTWLISQGRQARSSTLQVPTTPKTKYPKTLITQACTGRYPTRTTLVLGALLPIAMSRRGCLASTAPYKKYFIAAVRTPVTRISFNGAVILKAGTSMNAAPLNRPFLPGRKSVDWGLRKRGYVRVQATTMEANVPSIRLLEKCGFLLEGKLRSYRMVRGEPRDFFIFSKLRDGQTGR